MSGALHMQIICKHDAAAAYQTKKQILLRMPSPSLFSNSKSYTAYRQSSSGRCSLANALYSSLALAAASAMLRPSEEDLPAGAERSCLEATTMAVLSSLRR